MWTSFGHMTYVETNQIFNHLTNQKTQSIIQFIYKPIKLTKKLQRTIVGCHAESPARPSLMSTQFYPTAHSSLKSRQQSKEPGNYSAVACVTFFVYFLNVQKSLSLF